MRRFVLPTALLFALSANPARAYIEAPYSLGQFVNDARNIVVLELTRVNAEKGLLIFKKVADLKGNYPAQEVKHNIGTRGFHEREWKNVMAWAEVGKKAVFFFTDNASETCIHTYWYQCYQEGDWWGMSHAEPFLLRTFYGDPEKLVEIVTRLLKNEEVLVPCLADGDKNQLHQRKGKLQRLKASLKRLNYDAKRDFAAWGGDGDEIAEFKTIELLPAGAARWRFLPAREASNVGEGWAGTAFDDSRWRLGKTPIGYGEQEIENRKGTVIAEQGEDFLFRRVVDIPQELLAQQGLVLRLGVASDDNARVYLNGTLIDQDPEVDHEFAYWNRDIEVPLKHVKPGPNLIAALVKNHKGSSDLYLDMELTAQVPLPRKPKNVAAKGAAAAPTPAPAVAKPVEEPRDPNALKVDLPARTITLACAIAQRKLPNLDQQYPIEVIATYPAPRGQKAHETVVTFKGVRPSDVQKALAELGLKPGKPAYGDGTTAQGPEVKLFLEFTKPDGKAERIAFEKTLVHRDTGKPMVELKWYFTGSVMKQPDPEKDEHVLGADLTGTLVALFPVTDCTLFQSQLTMKDEPSFKLETNTQLLPKEGTAVKLIIQVP